MLRISSPSILWKLIFRWKNSKSSVWQSQSKLRLTISKIKKIIAASTPPKMSSSKPVTPFTTASRAMMEETRHIKNLAKACRQLQSAANLQRSAKVRTRKLQSLQSSSLRWWSLCLPTYLLMVLECTRFLLKDSVKTISGLSTKDLAMSFRAQLLSQLWFKAIELLRLMLGIPELFWVLLGTKTIS